MRPLLTIRLPGARPRVGGCDVSCFVARDSGSSPALRTHPPIVCSRLSLLNCSTHASKLRTRPALPSQFWYGYRSDVTADRSCNVHVLQCYGCNCHVTACARVRTSGWGGCVTHGKSRAHRALHFPIRSRLVPNSLGSSVPYKGKGNEESIVCRPSAPPLWSVRPRVDVHR